MIPFFAVLGALALGFAVFLLYIAVRYVPIIERNAFNVPRHRLPDDFTESGALIREDRVPLGDGGDLIVRRAAAAGKARGIALFCHETGAGWKSWTKHAGFLPNAGFDVIAFDYEAGPETCQWPAASELKKIEAVLAWIWREQKGVPVVAFGVSKGAVLASATLWHPAVQAAVLDGIFSTYATFENYMRKWVTIYVTPESVARAVPGFVYAMLSRLAIFYAGLRKRDRFFSAEDFSARFHKPALLVHAGKDHFASTAEVERIRGLFRAPARIWIAEGAAHSESARKQPDAYRSQILAFLQENLIPEKAEAGR